MAEYDQHYTEALQQLRDRIDLLDQDLVTLIRKRSALVEEVGELKRTFHPSACFIRPAREAAMIHAALAFDAGNFPKAHLAVIWRMLIAGSLNIEQTITAASMDETSWWLAREAFGISTRITRCRHADDVLAQVTSGQSRVGLIACHATDGNWWQKIFHHNQARIFAKAPYMASEPSPAWIIGDVVPEPTGDDESLWVVHHKEPLPNPTSPDAEWQMLAMDGEFSLWQAPAYGDASLGAAFAAIFPAALLDIRCIGSYARPAIITKEN